MKDITIIIPAGIETKIESLTSPNLRKKDIIIQRGPNPSKNRNNGVKKAKSKYVAFINAHTILSDNWFYETKKFFESHPEIDIFGGPQLNCKMDNLFARSSGYAFSSLFGAANVSTRYKRDKENLDADEISITSANLICKRSILKKVRFDEDLYPGEDPKFISDAKSAGFKVAYTPKIITYNLRRTSLNALARQIFNYGITRPMKESFFNTLKKPYFLVPPLFVIYMSILPILLLLNKNFIIPLLLYIFLNIIFSFYNGIKNKDIYSIFILPIIFFTIHISYGLGFISSLVIKRQ